VEGVEKTTPFVTDVTDVTDVVDRVNEERNDDVSLANRR